MTINCIAPLFVPADRPERYAKAAASGADAIIIDLEDAVTPAHKAAAREALRQGRSFLTGSVLVRVNGLGSAWHADDMAAIADLAVSGIVLPKCESAADIAATQCLWMPILAMIETARGLAAVREIAVGGAARLAFGSIDSAPTSEPHIHAWRCWRRDRRSYSPRGWRACHRRSMALRPISMTVL